MQIVYAHQSFPESWTSAIFLAGPTPRSTDVASWRPAAIEALERAGYDGVVMVPEVEDGVWKSGPDAYDAQVEWERRGLDLADVILFWIPRELPHMMGLTTNVEFGLYLKSDKVVLGAPPEAVSIKYLERIMRRDIGESHRYETIEDTVQGALQKINGYAPLKLRSGGERCVPLHIWSLPSFQSWYQNMVTVGNRLEDAKLLWHFKPQKARSVFSFVLWVKIWIASEQRFKANEIVLSRTDISSVVLYHHPEGSTDIMDTEIVLVREFRSPANTPDAMIHELPGGSSIKPGKHPCQVASDEVHEETGLIIKMDRFQALGSRQLAGTLSTHKSHLFAAPLTESEMITAKNLALAEEAQGVESDSERTYVEVCTFRELLYQAKVDWSTIGMISKVLLD